MKPIQNNKNFNFAHEKREIANAEISMRYLLQGEIEDFKAYITRFPYVVNMKEFEHGNVPLHVASSRGDLGLIQFLLQNGAEINVQDIFGNSPLHYATDKSKRSAIELLINCGANGNLQDFRGNAPLHLACTNNDLETVKLLLKFNADPEIIDLNELRPGDRTNSPMIKILLDRRINAVRTGEADTAQQSVQWMSFGVGLGVGLGVALAKYQQQMIEQQLKVQAEAAKPKRRGNFATVSRDAADDGAVVSYQSQSVPETPHSHSNSHEASALTKPQRKFL